MKLLMTTDGVGGVWTYAMELARGLAGDDVEVLLVSSGGPLTDAQRDEVATLDHVRLVETRFKLEWMEDPWEDVAELGCLLLELAAEFRPDVVHLNEYSHAALDWNVPTVVVGHSCVYSWFESVRGHAPGHEWEPYRQSVTAGLHSADIVVAPTRFMLGALQRHYGPLSNSKVISNGLSRGKIPATAKEPYIFSAGRWWDEAKNVAALADVASHVTWPIKVAGLPSPDATGRDLPRGLINLGRLSAREMTDEYARASIYCLPARYEPFGLTPLEAALAGCALVLGDLPSLREVWGDAAEFVPPNDAAAIAGQIHTLIADDTLRSERARRAQSLAGQYSRTRMSGAYMRLYRELIRNRVGTRAIALVEGIR